MTIRWMTAFIDRPAGTFDQAVRFWAAVTGSTLSRPRGEEREFATLLPPAGDAYLRVQRLADGSGGSHLDLHVDDMAGFARHAVAAGARQQDVYDDFVVMRSPAGLPWCIVGHAGEAVRPVPRPAGDTGQQYLVDQVSLDFPASRFEEECAFWGRLTGWERRPSTIRPEFEQLVAPDDQRLPLRLLLQRRDDEGPARGHLDVSSTDVDCVVAHHVALGARVTAVFRHWTVLADPSGLAYCVTSRDPSTGQIGPA